MDKTRVVVTGMGVMTPLGKSVPEYWEGLVNGRSGIRRITLFDPDVYDLPCKIAGEVPDFRPEAYLDRKEARRMSRASQLAIAAAQEAMQDAGFAACPDPERAGVVFATAQGGLERMTDGIEQLKEDRGISRISPFILPSGLPNMPAFTLARDFQALGPNSTIVTACAASTQSIGEGAVMIQRGVADVMIVGGVEAMIRDYTVAGFAAMRALPVNYNHAPHKACRPFDAHREGFVMSEGAGVLILESLEHARARGARIYAEVGGHASAADGFHVAALEPNAQGALRAMKWALQDAGVSPGEVDYINAHGTSTPANDPTETRAIKALFGERAYHIPISSTKSMIGHGLGAAGALEAIASILALVHGCIPPTINYETPDPDCDLDYVPNTARAYRANTILSNSFGLGGQNACLVLKRFNNHLEERA
jgi:beta-ketoacyl-acyl-carrier-protein synthase II